MWGNKMLSRKSSARRHLIHSAFMSGLAIALTYSSLSDASPLPDAFFQGDEEILGCFSNCQVSGGAALTAYGTPPGQWIQPVNGTFVPGQLIVLPRNLTEQSGDGTTIAQASVSTVLPFPSIDVTASISPDGPNNWGQNASVNVQFAYFFEITGPNGNVPVIVQAQGSNSAALPSTLGGYMSGSSNLNITQLSGPGGLNDNWGGNFVVAQELTLATNALYQISLQASASASDCTSTSCGPIAVTSESIVDPYFHFDPNFDSAGYSFVFSDGIDNNPPSNVTPVPPTLPLFATGLAGLGLLGWRKKQKA